MHLIVGLGNPGAQHSGHRHNVGFMAAGAIARRHGFSPAREKFHSLAAEGTLAGDKALILWPQTYMNDSGRAVQAAMQFYKAEPADVVVLYDEIDLEFGKVRVKKGGGTAGHNGIRSIDAHIGPDFWRVRIGVGHPGVKELVKHYVLHDFDAEEKPEVQKMIGTIADNFALLFERGHEHFMTKVALAINPPPPKPPRNEPQDGNGA
jgi:PTH1 family peptidyl-tRNA hydrolase